MCDVQASGVLRIDPPQVLAFDLAAKLPRTLGAGTLVSIREDSRYHQASFIEFAIGRCSERRADSVRWGKVAVTATAARSSRRIEELRALAWASLANAYRREGAVRQARTCALRAAELLATVTDPRDRVQAAAQIAVVFTELCEEDRARSLLESTLAEAHGIGDPVLVARLEIQVGVLLAKLDAWDEVVVWLSRAMDRLRGPVDPRLALLAGHTMAMAAIGLGENDAGVDMLWDLDELYRACGSELDRVSRRWLEARAEAARGRREAAISRLRAVERDLRELSPHHAALAALERAELELAAGQDGQAERTMLAAALALDRVGSPADTVRAVLALQHAVQTGGRREALLAEVARVRRLARRRV